MPKAAVRAVVPVPVRLADGSTVATRVHTFRGLVGGLEHLVIEFPGAASTTPLVRLHSECLTGDVLGSLRCDCGPQLAEAMALLADEGGYLLYLRQEGRGIGLYAKLDAYRLQDEGLDTFEANEALGYDADERDYAVAAQMLLALGLHRIRLLTNNPDKVAQLEELGIRVAEETRTGVHLSEANTAYLVAKVKAAHALTLPEDLAR